MFDILKFKKDLFYFFVFFQVSSHLFAQVTVSGSFQPSKMFRLTNQSEISLPFRIAEAEVGYSLGDFELKSNTAMEYRWENNENELQFREAYLMWYPSWGEVKVGKQIHAWGAVDGNNPTDNLNPYDYYYMFLPGADRKIGTVSGSVKYYWNDWQFEGVYIPDHVGNRVPFGEKDFPFGPPIDITEFIYNEKSPEFGIHVQTNIFGSDIGFSYFNGFDRMFSEFGIINPPTPGNILPVFAFRKTKAFGVNLVSFIQDFTLRSEASYFHSKKYDLENLNESGIWEEGEYIQFAFQLEYITENNLMISSQLIGQEIIYDSWDDYYENKSSSIDSVSIDHIYIRSFQPGLGTPFASFTDLGLLLSVSANYFDDALELMGNTFIDLKDSQSMLGMSANYTPINNWKINASISKFMGEEGTQFNNMEDFSHFQIGLAYHF